MKGRQAGKARRRYRLRVADGWDKTDAIICRTAELAANRYIKPEVTLGRPPKIRTWLDAAFDHAGRELAAEFERAEPAWHGRPVSP